jgi:zinc D-Ala-D-Ala carboxypeptidase
MPKMLSTHFSLDELIFSQTSARLGIDNTPDAAVLANLKRLAAVLEQVRELLGGTPIVVSSGYRSPNLNKAVGGAQNSAHLSGLAVDFTAPHFGSVMTTAKAIAKSDIAFDQLIFEYGRWVHLGLAPASVAAKRQLLSIGSTHTYVPGLKVV